MTHVITAACVGVKDGACVDACPVDCIHTSDDSGQFFIDPEECIDCGACIDPCPVNAIYDEPTLPENLLEYLEINRDFFD